MVPIQLNYLTLILIYYFMQLEVEALKFYDSTIFNLELIVRDVLKVVPYAYYI